MFTLHPAFCFPQKVTQEIQPSIDKRNNVFCQGELLGVGTGIQKCSGDAKNSDPRMWGTKGKQLPARLATDEHLSYKALPSS